MEPSQPAPCLPRAAEASSLTMSTPGTSPDRAVAAETPVLPAHREPSSKTPPKTHRVWGSGGTVGPERLRGRGLAAFGPQTGTILIPQTDRQTDRHPASPSDLFSGLSMGFLPRSSGGAMGSVATGSRSRTGTPTPTHKHLHTGTVNTDVDNTHQHAPMPVNTHAHTTWPIPQAASAHGHHGNG